jgi:hypothetical protein
MSEVEVKFVQLNIDFEAVYVDKHVFSVDQLFSKNWICHNSGKIVYAENQS